MLGKSVYYAKQGNDFYIYQPDTDSDHADLSIDMNLYKNEKLLDSISGMLGDFELKGDNVLLKINNKMTKSTNELYIDGSKVELIKIKEKELRKILSKANIYNGVNPTKAQLDAEKFDPKLLLIPGLLFVAGIITQYFVRNLEGKLEFLFIIPLGIAGYMFGHILEERYPWLAGGKYGKTGYAFVGIVVGGLLGEFLFRFI